MGLYLEVLKIWGKDKIKKYTGLYSEFCFGVYSIYSLYLVTHLPIKNPGCAPAYGYSTLYITYFGNGP